MLRCVPLNLTADVIGLGTSLRCRSDAGVIKPRVVPDAMQIVTDVTEIYF